MSALRNTPRLPHPPKVDWNVQLPGETPSNESIQKRNAISRLFVCCGMQRGTFADIYISLSVESLEQFTDVLHVQLHTWRGHKEKVT